jgi:predicted HTH domain antitoxin
MRYLGKMHTIRAEIPAELAVLAGFEAENISIETARLVALELFREDKLSLGRAADLCQTPLG